MGYKVTDKNGNTVNVGDMVTDFRGDVSTFRGVTRGVEYNGTAKVSVRQNGYDRELYATVFGLTVETVDLTAAINVMAETLARVDSSDTWSSFTCDEVETIATVLQLSGHRSRAEFILELHAVGDEPGDDHYTGTEGI